MTMGAKRPFRWNVAIDGLTWKGLALVALLCLINSVRRSIRDFWSDYNYGVAEIAERWANMLSTGLVVALAVTIAVVVTYNHVSPDPRRRYPALAAAVLLSSLVGVGILFALEPVNWPQLLNDPLELFRGTWLRYALLGGLFTAVYVYLRGADESTARARQAELDRAAFDQHIDEARLQVLQAQIEPHFLFNTLSTVRRLYRTAPGSAVAMLDNLMRYLTVALPQMRVSDSTLGRETKLARAYLAIQQIRMGTRLAFEIDVPAALDRARMPPMMLLTLAENAIKHGLDPLPEGGFIHISADIDNERLRLRVADTGRGFVSSSGAGTGLANIRARLAAQFGSRGQLDLAQNRPRGITATISVPAVLPDAEAAMS